MKKFRNVLAVAVLSLSLLPATLAYGAEKNYVNKSGEGFHIVVEDSEKAIPDSTTKMSRAGIDWTWGLYVDGGWTGGYDVSAMSGATATVDYLYVKAEMFFKDGSIRSNSHSENNSDNCETSFYDRSTGDRPRANSTFKSTHTFRHTGYKSTTKYVTRDLADI